MIVIYNAMHILVLFENKNIFFLLNKRSSLLHRCRVIVNSLVIGLAPGTDVMILKILQKNWRFLLKTKLNYATFGSYNWFLRKKPIFSPKIVKNRRKL
jgi:hypothetical protein